MESRRPPEGARSFRSAAIEDVIADVSGRIADPETAWLFGNCFPNTLDTTIAHGEDADGRPDTFVITGDINAMWLRDSTNQVWPYLPFVRRDPALNRLIQGVIHRQAKCVLLDPYANAFNGDGQPPSHWQSDRTAMRPEVYERKYELDSLCAALRLSAGYYRHGGDTSVFDDRWQQAVALILRTITVEQAGTDEAASPYRFERVTPRATDTLIGDGVGHPARRCGLSRSPFRPSDDAASLPFLVPANAMATVCLRDLAALQDALGRPDAAQDARALAGEIDAGLIRHGTVNHPARGPVYAYEVDGYGSAYCMDDANVPSLLSLPYLGYCATDDPLYQNTRAFVLSADNPYYAEGAAGAGIGGPHIGPGFIWPMSIIMRALTAQNEGEVVACLRTLKNSHAGTGFLHEAFWKDDAANYTRDWFAWTNTLFGELILHVDARWPGLLGRL